MRALAFFVMRGRGQATMVVTVLAILSVLVTPLSFLSAAAVALVGLRLGAKEGLLVIFMSWIAAGVLSYLLFSTILPATGFALILWLPVFLLAMVLRSTGSLVLALETALFFAMLVIAGLYLAFDSPAAHWAGIMEEPLRNLLTGSEVDDVQFQQILLNVAEWMTAVLTAGYFLQLSLSLFIGRWWQAVMYNPGGFGEEFRRLGFHQTLALVAAPGLVWMALGDPPQWLIAVSGVFIAAWFLQGLAVAHGLLHALRAHIAWIAGIYVLLLVAMPYLFMALAMTGYSDAWMNFRRNVAASGNGSE